MYLVFAVLVFAGVSFVREWMPPDMVAMFSLGIILLPGIFGFNILEANELTSAFSNPAPLTIACMFVMSAGLEKSGCIRALGSGFKSIAGGTELRVLIILMGLGAVLSSRCRIFANCFVTCQVHGTEIIQAPDAAFLCLHPRRDMHSDRFIDESDN